MSIFGSIMSKIFSAADAVRGNQGSSPSATPPTELVSSSASSNDSGASSQAGAGAAATAPVDVEAVLTQMAAGKGGGGNWRTSIVDLLKLLDLESSLDARKQLANELNVHAGADGSAEENIALHKAVMQKLAENGGKVPDSLKA